MTIIAKGNSTNIPLAAGLQITVKPLGQAAPTVTVRNVSGGAIQLDTVATAQATYGPFVADTNVDIDAINDAVEVLFASAPSTVYTSGMFYSDAIVIGDSFNAQAWITSATNSAAMANGWVNHLQWKLNGRLKIGANIAVVGKRMDEVVNEQLPAAAASSAGIVILTTAGTNDVTFGRTAAQIIASLQSIFQACLTAGKMVVTGPIPPRGSTSFSAQAFTAGQLAVVLAVNAWLRERAKALYPNVIIVDFARRLIDVSSIGNANTYWMTDAYTVDGLHPNSLGSIIMADEGVATLQNLLPPIRRTANASSSGTVGDLTNSFRNALLLGTGGTIGTGVGATAQPIPQFWGVGRSSGGSNTIVGLCTQEARSVSFNDGAVGNVIRVDLSAAGAVGDRFTVYPVPIDQVPIAGETWYFTQEIDVQMSAGTLVEIVAGGTVTGGATLAFTAGLNVGAASWGVTTYRGTLRSRDFVIQAGATGFAFQTDIRTSAGATGTVRFGLSELRKVATP